MTAPDRPPGSRSRRYPAAVVGVGASAGGLEAMTLLFSQLRPAGQAAYLVAQHMADGAHGSLVARLIQRVCALPVEIGSDGQVLQPDRVTVIPGGRHGVVEGGCLRLLPRRPDLLSTPSVDLLLSSLAHELGPRAVGIVLSGAGRDGGEGCRRLLRGGGRVLAQEPREAGFESMPAAVGGLNGVLVRTAGEIGVWLNRNFGAPEPEQPISRASVTPPARGPSVAVSGAAFTVPRDLNAVVRRVRETTAIDFSEYRPETLRRRLRARQAHLRLDETGYEALLARDSAEAARLQKLFLVSLSWFWRDRACFEALAEALRPRLAGRPDGAAVRAWTAGCASGEEAFTLAAMLSELAAGMGRRWDIEVLGTDLNEQALAQATAGEFQDKGFREAPDGWAERWFRRAGGVLTARDELRRMVRFEKADIETGLPGRLVEGDVDIISCRNLLIYFQPAKQLRLFAQFARALRPDGVLFLGLSEGLGGDAAGWFRPVDVSRRVFARKL